MAKSGPKPMAPGTSETVDQLAVRLQRMSWCDTTFGSFLSACFGDDLPGRKKALNLCQLLAVAALETLLDPNIEVLESMLGRSCVPNMVLARSLFRSGIEGALGRNLPPRRAQAVATRAVSGVAS